MALTLSQTGIETSTTVEAWHVTQSIDAFTGTEAYDITLSGSFNMTGPITGEPGVINDLTASYAISASYVLTASFLQGSVTSASYALTASLAPNFANTDLTLTGTRIHQTDNKGLWITSDTSSLILGQYLYFEQPTSIMGASITQSRIGVDDTYFLFYKSSFAGHYIQQYVEGIEVYSAISTGIVFNDFNSDFDFEIKNISGSALYSDASTNRVGINTNSPQSDLHVSGSFSGGFRNIDANVSTTSSGFPLLENDYIVTFTANLTAMGTQNLILLPSASAGRVLILQRVAGLGECAVSGSGAALINSSSGYLFDPSGLSVTYKQRTFVSDGINWFTEP